MSIEVGLNISELSKSSFSTKPLVSYAVLATAVFMAIDPPNIKTVDAIGYLAASLVLATFSMRSMSSLRLVGLASNLAFIAYGYLGNLTPVLVLHALLLPVNACRLAQLLRTASNQQVGEEQRGAAPRPSAEDLESLVELPTRVVSSRGALSAANDAILNSLGFEPSRGKCTQG